MGVPLSQRADIATEDGEQDFSVKAARDEASPGKRSREDRRDLGSIYSLALSKDERKRQDQLMEDQPYTSSKQTFIEKAGSSFKTSNVFTNHHADQKDSVFESIHEAAAPHAHSGVVN